MPVRSYQLRCVSAEMRWPSSSWEGMFTFPSSESLTQYPMWAVPHSCFFILSDKCFKSTTPPKSKHGKQKSDLFVTLAVSKSLRPNHVTQNVRLCRLSLCVILMSFGRCASLLLIFPHQTSRKIDEKVNSPPHSSCSWPPNLLLLCESRIRAIIGCWLSGTQGGSLGWTKLAHMRSIWRRLQGAC